MRLIFFPCVNHVSQVWPICISTDTADAIANDLLSAGLLDARNIIVGEYVFFCVRWSGTVLTSPEYVANGPSCVETGNLQ